MGRGHKKGHAWAQRVVGWAEWVGMTERALLTLLRDPNAYRLNRLPRGAGVESDGVTSLPPHRVAKEGNAYELFGALSRKTAARLWDDERGLASVEYVIVLVAVTLGAALLLAAMGPTLIRSFEWQVAVLGLPIP